MIPEDRTGDATRDGQVPVDPSLDVPSERPGDAIGPYKIVRPLGEGGFGSVYMAEQERPVRRTVAIKIIKLGMDTRLVVARFEQERQALAVMDHPNIARVLDAGATETGRPYFVMELVKGEPIVAYCDRNHLSIRDRLELFSQVCHAVQHAHSKGIIHRDIKPTNVLVGTQDGKPLAKVIDFGIAKATSVRLTERTLFTEHKQLIGTPEYMSPEQAEGSIDIDTRTDVYSLGVLLYELLTGTTPFDGKSLRSAAYAEIQRIIREVEPPKPSTRLSASGKTLLNAAAHRHTEPGRLSTILRGELDWIVMKAMEKDRARRYETANGLALDVRRYLAGEPVTAAPPSVSYRASKFVKRHRVAVGAVALAAVALVGGVVAFAWQAQQAREQRDLAVRAQAAESEQRRVAERERSEAQAQREAASLEAARAKAMNTFIEQMLLAADPSLKGSRDVTVLQLLSKASAKASTSFKGQPEDEAVARTFLGHTLCSLGSVDAALVELKAAMALHESVGGKPTMRWAETLRSLGEAYTDQGDHQAALASYQRALEVLLALGDERGKELSIAYCDAARELVRLSKFAEAEALVNKAEGVLDRLKIDGPDVRAYIASERSVSAREWKEDLALAERYADEEVAYRRKGAADPVEFVDSLNNLGVAKMTAGKYDEALVIYDEAIATATRAFGENNQRVATFTENKANILYRRKDFPKAMEMLKKVIAIRETVFGPDALVVARSRLNMGSIALNTGDFKAALELTEAAIPAFKKNMGDQNMDFAVALRNRAQANKGLGNLDLALADFRAAVAIYDAVATPTSVPRLRALLAIAEILCTQLKPDEARAAAEQATKALDPAKPDHAKWVKDFAALLERCGTPDTAAPPSPPASPAPGSK